MDLISREDARAMQLRAERADAAQRERDQRRADYDAAMDLMPTRRVLDMMRERVAPSRAYHMQLPRIPRVHKDSGEGACPKHGYSRDRCGCTGNAWELQAPHMATHKAPDHSCHHPLVKCSHRW